MHVYRYTIVQLKILLNVDGHIVKITVATFITVSSSSLCELSSNLCMTGKFYLWILQGSDVLWVSDGGFEWIIIVYNTSSVKAFYWIIWI
jgi:hypothetical protein